MKEKNKIYYIYVLINKINGKLYIGQTINIKGRIHRYKYQGKTVSNSAIYSAVKKYGWGNFEMAIMEEYVTQKEVDAAEVFWINFLQTRNKSIGYNIAIGGKGGGGFPHSDKTKQKLREYALAQDMRGSKNAMAKWTDLEIKEIRNDFLSLKYTIDELAEKYKSPRRSMFSIVFNKKYQDSNYRLSDEFLEKYKILRNKSRNDKIKKERDKISLPF